MIPIIIFWISVGIIFHSYVLYPFIVKTLAGGKKNNQNIYTHNQSFPTVSILLAVYNEETVIEKKLISLDELVYPKNRLEILIRSDASSDKTDQIIKNSKAYHNVQFKRNAFRKGKVRIINELSKIAKGEILVITDANVLHKPDSLTFLIRHFRNKEIGLVDSAMINPVMDKQGISIQESAYIAREVKIKNAEGKLWGCMMGPSGGFYALRKDLFDPVPDNYLVDDFYLNMVVLEKGKKAINDLESVAYEDVSNNLSEEFRRKVRISAGNFQNLVRFFKHLFHPFQPIGFVFFSHKVSRWIGPFFLLSIYVSNLFLLNKTFYFGSFLLQSIFLLLPFLDLILRKIKIQIVILRFVTHFYNMNLAMLVGYLKFLKGITSNVWEPTKRNQS